MTGDVSLVWDYNNYTSNYYNLFHDDDDIQKVDLVDDREVNKDDHEDVGDDCEDVTDNCEDVTDAHEDVRDEHEDVGDKCEDIRDDDLNDISDEDLEDVDFENARDDNDYEFSIAHRVVLRRRSCPAEEADDSESS